MCAQCGSAPDWHPPARADTIIHQTFNHQKVPLALRLSGQLLLGVVRIYTRKLDFLQRDSAEALVKFRQVRCGGRHNNTRLRHF
jgi:hypothetical protein